VAETNFKRFLWYGFRRTGKAMGQVLVEDMLRNVYFIFRFNYHIFYVSHKFVTYLLTVSGIRMSLGLSYLRLTMYEIGPGEFWLQYIALNIRTYRIS
jgi:hypothetical protein